MTCNPSWRATPHRAGMARLVARRSVLATALLPTAPALATTSSIRLRPGGPRLAITARIEAHPTAREALAIAFTGRGAPEARILLPSWYGRARVLHALPVEDREVLVAAFEGNRGTGIYQELMAVIGADDAGRLRVLAIETLSFRDQQTGAGWRRMSGRFQVERGHAALRLAMQSTARLPQAPEPARDEQEGWTTLLLWGGKGPLRPAAPTPAQASTLRRRVDTAREKVLALLAEPVTDVTRLDLEETGLWSVGYAIT